MPEDPYPPNPLVRVTTLEKYDTGDPEYMIVAGDGTQPSFVYMRLSAEDTARLMWTLMLRLAGSKRGRAALQALNPYIKEEQEGDPHV